MLKWTIGGFADEFYRRLGQHYKTGGPEYFFESSIAEKVYLDMLKEAGVEVRYGASVDKVTKDGAQHQVVDFIPGQPEKCEQLNGPPEF
jgi:hypothetical protein